jgi:hypothetical protein
MGDAIKEARRLMAEGDDAAAVELLFDHLQSNGHDGEARQLLRECLSRQHETRLPDTITRSVRRIAGLFTLLVVFAVPWVCLLSTVTLLAGIRHYLVLCLFGAGSMIFPLASSLSTAERHPARPSLDRLAVMIAFGWLAISTLWIFARVDKHSVTFAFLVIFVGSVLIPMLVLLTNRPRARIGDVGAGQDDSDDRSAEG